MIIIAVSGRQNRGKTHSTIRFQELLLQELDRNKVNYIKEPYEASGTDIRTIVKFNDIAVCICSGGDSKQIIEENFGLARQNGCNVLISAVRHKWNHIPHEFYSAMNPDELLIDYPTAVIDNSFSGTCIAADKLEIIYDLNAKNILCIFQRISEKFMKPGTGK